MQGVHSLFSWSWLLLRPAIFVQLPPMSEVENHHRFCSLRERCPHVMLRSWCWEVTMMLYKRQGIYISSGLAPQRNPRKEMIFSSTPALVFHLSHMIYHRLTLDPVIQTYTPTTWILITWRMVNFTAKKKKNEYALTSLLSGSQVGRRDFWFKKKKRISGSKFQDTLSNVHVLNTAK